MGRESGTGLRRVAGTILLAALAAFPAAAAGSERCAGDRGECLEALAKEIAAKLAASGWIGVELGCDKAGEAFEVIGVVQGSPADAGGALAGDVLVSMNGEPLPDCTPCTLAKIRREHAPGKTVTYVVERGDGRREIRITSKPITADALAKYLGRYMEEKESEERARERRVEKR